MAHRRRFSNNSNRRKTDWVGWPDAAQSAITGNTNTLFSSAVFAAPTTIVRTRGIITVGVQSTAADLEITGAFGCAIVSEEAAAAGAASIPGPWTQNDWDGWFVLQPFSLILEITTDIGVQQIMSEYVIDSKGMRKAEDGDRLVCMVESSSGSAYTFSDMTRHLAMLA